MSNVHGSYQENRRKRRRWSIGAVVAAFFMFGAFVIATASNADPVYDPNKVVPNAAGKNAGYGDNSDGDCSTEQFLAQDQDLWHFVVPRENIRIGSGSTAVSYRLTANITAVIIQWEGGGLERYTGTDDYDQGNAGPNLFWIYTEPGRTIEQAWLEYSVTRDDGESATETFLTTPHNLSHACAVALNEPPTVDINPDAFYDVLYDLTYDWTIDKSVDPTGLLASGSDPFVLRYTVQASRVEPAVAGNWRIVDGSMVLTGVVILTNATINDVVVVTDGGTCEVSDDSVPGDDNYVFECLIINEPSITSAAGLDGSGATVSATVTTTFGTDTDSEVIPWGEPDSVTLADVFHETAYIVDGERQSSASSGPLSLEYTVEWLPTECPDQRVNVAELFDGVTNEPLGIDDTLVITGCTPVPGRTIGYWGNRIGAPQVVAAFPELSVQYPALAAIPITNEASVRNYFTKASCTGDCVTMFLAQALATAMNARNGAFGDQPVFFDGACRTVDEWLDIALRTAVPTTRTARIAYKTLFDDLNNTRATRCASIG
jgi:hypothetical protein